MGVCVPPAYNPGKQTPSNPDSEASHLDSVIPPFLPTFSLQP